MEAKCDLKSLKNIDEVEQIKKILERERKARKTAEAILEKRSLELYEANLKLKNLNNSLSQKLDVTAKKYERIARIAEESPNPIYRFDKNGYLMYVNKAGRNLLKTLSNDDVQNINKKFLILGDECLQKNQSFRSVLNIGARHYCILVVPVIEHSYYNIFINDVTIQKNAENLLKLSQEKYKRVVNDMKLGIVEVDTDLVILTCNDRFLKVTGYDAHDIIGKNGEELFLTSETDKQFIHEQKDKSKYNEGQVFEIKIQAKDGNYKWLMASMTPNYDEENHIKGYIGTFVDITSRKQTENELLKAKKEAEESSKAKERFLANMSHEIRTPLNAILGMANLLNNTSITPKQQAYMDTISDSAKILQVIINDILDITKIDSGKLTLEHVGFKLKDVINTIVRTNTLKAEEKEVLIDTNIGPNISKILISDPVRITQILSNLVSNAVKFTMEGSVHIEAKLIGESQSHQSIEFQVVDTGIGIDSEKLKLIFEEFQQEDNSTTRNFGGSGLGLAISQKLAHMLGGHIHVNSIKGVGSTFYFKVNLKKGDQSDLPKQSNYKLDTSLLQDLSILLVEDNNFNQLLFKSIFEGINLKIDIAENGARAVDIIQTKKYDIVLMDIQTPIMNGIEATKIIRKKLKLDLPIIAMTANALNGDKEKYLNAGMTDYISKPCEPNDLFLMIAKHCNKNIVKKTEEEPAKEKTETKEINGDRDTFFKLDTIKRMSDNNTEFIKQLIGTFIQYTPSTIKEMQHAFEKRNFKKVATLAHRIKPSFNTFEIFSLKEDILKLENEYNEMSESQIKESLSKIVHITNETIKQMEKI